MPARTLLIPPILPVPSILPHAHDPAAARRVVAAVRALLADTVVKETRSDALYGITMRADGVSAAISQRLERRG